MTTAPAIEMLTVGEDALERGRAHGEQFAAQVHSNLNTYLQRFSSSGLNHDEGASL